MLCMPNADIAGMASCRIAFFTLRTRFLWH
jgi:hypothetical protein